MASENNLTNSAVKDQLSTQTLTASPVCCPLLKSASKLFDAYKCSNKTRLLHECTPGGISDCFFLFKTHHHFLAFILVDEILEFSLFFNAAVSKVPNFIIYKNVIYLN